VFSFRFGRALPRLLRDAALTGVNAEARIPMTGSDTVRLQRTLALRHREQMLAAGLLTSGEIGQHLAGTADGSLDLAAFPVVSARGRKPGWTGHGTGRRPYDLRHAAVSLWLTRPPSGWACALTGRGMITLTPCRWPRSTRPRSYQVGP
jgi:hypothetical protein